MGWCSYCKDSGGFFSTSYTCGLTNKYIPDDYKEDYCQFDYKIPNCPWYKEYGPSSSSSFCFITTITCNILGKDDKDPVMESLRSLRNDYLQKNPDYDFVLKAYDTIGKKAAQKISEDEKRETEAKVIYYSVLSPIANLVNDKEYELAAEMYYCMTLGIYKKYGLLDEYNELMASDFGYKEGEFDPERAGHGIKLTNPEVKSEI